VERETFRLYLDTEFNSHGGKLISLALTSTQGHEFYEVVEMVDTVHPWVAEHVIPVLGSNKPLPLAEFSARLAEFLGSLPALGGPIEVVADYPDDIRHFCEALVTGPGTTVDYPSTLHFTLVTLPDFSSAEESAVPHNALADARALMRYCTDPRYMPGWGMT
jgi:hypothetical protein